MKKNIILICLLCSLGHLAFSQGLDKTISLDSSYSTSMQTNRAFWNFGLEFEYGGAALFDFVGTGTFIGSNAISRTLWILVMAEAWSIPQYSFFVSNHELGHGSRAVAAGFKPVYAWSVAGADNHDNIFSFFIDGMSRFEKGATTTSGTSTHAMPLEWNTTVLLTAGMNNSAMYSEFLEREVYYNTGHINQLRAYERGKMDTYNYVLNTQVGSGVGDVDKLLTIYNAKNYGITADDLKTGSNTSRLLSFTYWAYIYGLYNYVVSGDPVVKAFEVGGFKLPDIAHYLSRKGVSYKLTSGFKGSDYVIPFSIEKTYRGIDVTEVSLGYRLPHKFSFNRFGAYEVQLTYNDTGAMGYEISGDFEVGTSMILSAGYNSYDTETLIGERNGGLLNDAGKVAEEIWARASWIY